MKQNNYFNAKFVEKKVPQLIINVLLIVMILSCTVSGLFSQSRFIFKPDTMSSVLTIHTNAYTVSVPQGAKVEIDGFSQLCHTGEGANIYIGEPINGQYKVIYTSPEGKETEGILFIEKPKIFSNTTILLGSVTTASAILLIYFSFRVSFAHERKRLMRRIYEQTETLIEEQERHEQLIAREEQGIQEAKKQKAKGVRYKMVTILFSNVVGFSKLTEQNKAERLIDDLDKFYYHFDNTVKGFNIKKIKTIGDTYVCAGGIPKKNRTNPIDVVLAAFEMQQYMMHLKSRYSGDDEKIWGIRMGIHTGPVFAQFDNMKSQKYDIWGETVNIANRVESTGEMGKVNISGSTYELVKDYFQCQYYGKLPVKYRGEADLYVIEGFRPHLSVNGAGLEPNQKFLVKFAFVRFDDLEEYVLDKLERELPKKLYYHNVKHTIDVVNQVEIIARREQVNEEELLLLKTAALFHDIGFTVGYKDHELLGIKITKETLPRYYYSEEQISRICDLIFATRLPPAPTNKLEEIMCDADLDYLGRADFVPVSNMLFKELVENEVIESNIEKWNEMQIAFISGHQYFTQSAKLLRDVNKNKQLENIRNLANH